MRKLGASIPIIVGNLGAAAMIATARREPVVRDPLVDDLQRLADLGVDEVEDYVGWNVVEPAPGALDFRLHLEHREAAERAGLGYVLYPWVHALPRWMLDDPRLVPYRCLEHGGAIAWPSPFAPATVELFDHFYACIARELGAPARLSIACPSDYGEVGFPNGMGAWATPFPAGLDHVHGGYWCGDACARASFARFAKERGLPSALAAEPAGPAVPPAARTAFVRWYKSALLEFVGAALGVARRHFPRSELAVKCGYADEQAEVGADYTRLGRLAAERGAALWSTHATLPVVFHKRLATICRQFRIPYQTEGPTERTREHVLDRLFEDSADGAAALFEFHDTFKAHEGEFLARARHLRGEPPLVDVALLFHSSAMAENPALGLPPRLHELGEPLRDLLDYEVVDEDLLEEAGVLDRYGVLGLPDGGALRPETERTIEDFARRGGIVVQADPALGAVDGALHFGAAPADSMAIRFGRDDWLLHGEVHGLERAAPYFGGDSEERCAWIGAAAGFRFPLPPDAEFALELELFLPPEGAPRSWRLFANGEVAAAEFRPGAQVVRCTVATGAASAGAVAFELSGATFRPSDAGASRDQRQLGLLLRSARLTRAGARPLPLEAAALAPLDVRADAALLRARWFRPVGRGGVLRAPARDPAAFAAFLMVASAKRSALATAARDFWQPDGRHDGVRVARFERRLLIYNRNPRPACPEFVLSDGGRQRVPLAPYALTELALPAL